jgi:hypothetical protein
MVIGINTFPPVAATHNMIDRARILDAQLPSHGGARANQPIPLVSIEYYNLINRSLCFTDPAARPRQDSAKVPRLTAAALSCWLMHGASDRNEAEQQGNAMGP